MKTVCICCILAGANAQRVMPFLGYLPLKGYADGWADAEKGAHGPGIVDRTQEPGLFVFRQLGGRLRANLRSSKPLRRSNHGYLPAVPR